MRNLPIWLSLVLAAAVATVAADMTATAARDTPGWVSSACQPASLGPALWRDLQLDLDPTPGSPAAFRLADQRNLTLWQNTLPGLQPTPGSPAAFRLADQRDLVATAQACLRAGAAKSHST
jgi:hypothetical protein